MFTFYVDIFKSIYANLDYMPGARNELFYSNGELKCTQEKYSFSILEIDSTKKVIEEKVKDTNVTFIEIA